MTLNMVLALLLYALTERKLCLGLAESGENLPDQVSKPPHTPTMRWVFHLFEGIDLLIVYQDGAIPSRHVLNLRSVHRTVLRMLGPPVGYCYLQAS